MMTWVWVKVRAFRHNEDGVTAIEYSVIIAMISGTLLITLPLLGANISNPLDQLASAIDNGGGASSGADDEGDVGSDDSGDDGGDDDDDDDEGDDDDDGGDDGYDD